MTDYNKLANEANTYFYNADYNKALSIYYQILAANLNNSYSYYNIGLAYEMLGELELAVSYYKKAVRIDNNIRSINNLARIYISSIKDYNIAKEYLDFAIKTAPDDAEAYNLYAEVSILYKDYKLAENYLKKSIFLDNKFFKNYYDLANVYYLLNDKQNALDNITKCLDLKGDFSSALELKEKIISM